MFSLLSAMTDEINKIKTKKTFQQIEVDNDELQDNNYETDENDNSDSENDDSDDYDDDDEEDEDEDQEDDHDDKDEDEDNHDESQKQGVDIAETYDNQNSSYKSLNEIDLTNNSDVGETDTNYQSANVVDEITDKEVNLNLENIDYNSLSLKALRDLAKQKGLSGENISKLKKGDLIKLLTSTSIKLE